MKYIYGLVDPRDRSIRYVGQTDNLTTRLQQHLSDKSNTPKVEWIRGLKATNLQPEIIRLATVHDGEDAHLVEYRWIYFARKNGWLLTNTSAMKTEEYYSLQGYFERLIVEMEKPEGVAEHEYGWSDVRGKIFKNLVLLLEWFPSIAGLISIVIIDLFRAKVFPASFAFLSTALYVITYLSLVQGVHPDNMSPTQIALGVAAVFGGIGSLITTIATSVDGDGSSGAMWTLGAIFLGLTYIASMFLQG